MSRFIPHNDLSAAEIIKCSYDALALVELCEYAANDLSERSERMPTVLGSISSALAIASELMTAVHDTVEIYERAIDEAKS